MKPRLTLTLWVDTQAHADTVVNSVQNQLSGKDIHELHRLDTRVDLDGSILVQADIRFNGSIDRDAVRDWIRDQLTNTAARNWVYRVRVLWHLCGHDESPPVSCRETIRTWQREA